MLARTAAPGKCPRASPAAAMPPAPSAAAAKACCSRFASRPSICVAAVSSDVHWNFAYISNPPNCAAGRWAIALGRSCPRQYRWPSRTARPLRKTMWSCRNTAFRCLGASAAGLRHHLPFSSCAVLAPVLLAGRAAQHIGLAQGSNAHLVILYVSEYSIHMRTYVSRLSAVCFLPPVHDLKVPVRVCPVGYRRRFLFASDWPQYLQSDQSLEVSTLKP